MFAALLAITAFGCKKDVNPDLPALNWASNPSFSQQELVPGLDGVVSVTAPGKIDALTITLGLGEYAILANPYIGVSSNKGTASKSPVFDIVDDSVTAGFFSKLGMQVGSSLRGKTATTIDLVAVLESLIAAQPVQNNTNFTMKIDLKDQAGKSVSSTAKFHFTSAPAFSWDGNSSFAIVDLNGSVVPAKIRINAPGRFEKLTITLENGADDKLMSYVKNRTAGRTNVIDLIEDATVATSFKSYFPAGTSVAGKTDVTLDFAFMFDQRYDMGASTNVFTINAIDRNGKSTSAQVKFKK